MDDAFRALAGILLANLGIDASHADSSYGSMSVVLGYARLGRAKAVPELCNSKVNL